uniref:Anti-Mullerian hormone n=1 Tax=Danio rerio TaxID=7955 RepID=A8E7B8_DANRE|nr:muellerian-inhibiting factor isoform X1 [Danio rerio]|eukprot:XP_009294509.1 muellerian-inhibiting factor isoform X1 [Danio rerio]
MLFQARFGLMLMMTVAIGSYCATVRHEEQDNNPKVNPLSELNGDQLEVRDLACVHRQQPTDQYATEDTPFNKEQKTLNEFLSALKSAGELGKMDFVGTCSPETQSSQVSHLVQSVLQKQSGLKGVHATEDIWDADNEGGITLTLTFPKHSLPAGPASVMLLFSVNPVKGDSLRVQFNSQSIHPNTQTVCISESTRFLIVTGGWSHGHIHLKLKTMVETSMDDNRPKLSVSELKEVLMRKVDSSSTMIKPVLLFLSDLEEPRLKHHRIPQDERLPSRTYLFLCELQKFLRDILPQSKSTTPQDDPSAVSLDTLHSLPPLRLGVSSTESLLSGLVNSSTPTVFVFPQRQQGLQTHRVEVTLDSPLLSVLRMRLDEAMAQVKQQEAGRKMIDRLQKLTELSALSPDGEDSEAATKDHKEAQYRSVLLLKALQMVLSNWESERAQRAARADEDGPSASNQCHLQSLSVSLRKFFLEPSRANINNCEGTCGFPLNNANNHAVLLNSHIQSGQPVNRSLCCVPVEYDDLCVIELESETTNISYKTNVVATKCECR